MSPEKKGMEPFHCSCKDVCPFRKQDVRTIIKRLEECKNQYWKDSNTNQKIDNLIFELKVKINE